MRTKIALFLATLLILPTLAFGEIKGKFEILAPAIAPAEHSLDQVEIVEVFSFACGYCYKLNKKLPELKKRFGNKIKLISQPTGWNGMDPGRLFFIAEEKGKGVKVKDMIFDFYHAKGLGGSMYTRDKLQFVARLTGLHGDFKKRMDDPKIVAQMNQSMAYAQEKQVTGTPTLIIQGMIKASGDINNLGVIINSLLKNPVN